MGKLYFILLILLGVYSVNAQIVTFSDPDFKAKLLYPNTPQVLTSKDLSGNPITIDANGDGEIEVSEAQNISELMIINDWAITDITGIGAFSNLRKLNFGSTGLNNADLSMMHHLEVVVLSHSNMTSLVLPPPNGLLVGLVVSGNQLTSLDVSQYPELQTLYCASNLLTQLDISNLTNLEYLECDHNQIPVLNINTGNLKWLRCSYNQIQSLDLSNQNQLSAIYCENNSLTELNLANTYGGALNCSNNQLTTLSVDGWSWLELDFSHNNITNFNFYENLGLGGLTSINCSYNQLTSITIPWNFQNLHSLDCSHNQISTLDLGVAVTLDCSYNNLVQLALKDYEILYQYIELPFVHFEGNPLAYICADGPAIEQAYELLALHGITDCEVNPYCSFNPGGIFYTISGANTLDANGNGCNATDPIFPNLRYDISNGTTSGSLISDSSGNYTHAVQSGSYTIAPVIENPNYFNIYPASVTVNFPTQSSPFIQNFCLTPNGLHPDLEIALFPLDIARPGFDGRYKLTCRNKGNQTQSGAIHLNFDDALLDVINSNPSVQSSAANALTWNFSDLQPFQTFDVLFVMNVNSPVETPPVNGGDILHFIANVETFAADETPNDNTATLNQTVVNSFDPNDKICLEGNTILPEMAGEYVHYRIRFENTGTFFAENIVVKDIIDTTKFDINSLVVLDGSHNFFTRINGNKVEFIFENINLAFWPEANNGYVLFKIKTLPTLVLGDTFSNAASIYFDYNHPIVTEPAVTTLSLLKTQDFAFDDYFAVYPNPANDVLHIQSKQDIETQSLGVYNLLGQLVLKIANANGVAQIDVSKLKPGNYFLKIGSDRGTSNARFIKQ